MGLSHLEIHPEIQGFATFVEGLHNPGLEKNLWVLNMLMKV